MHANMFFYKLIIRSRVLTRSRLEFLARMEPRWYSVFQQETYCLADASFFMSTAIGEHFWGPLFDQGLWNSGAVILSFFIYWKNYSYRKTVPLTYYLDHKGTVHTGKVE